MELVVSITLFCSQFGNRGKRRRLIKKSEMKSVKCNKKQFYEVIYSEEEVLSCQVL